MRSCELQIAISGVVTLNGGHYPHISSQPSAQVREVGWAAQMGPTDYRAERLRDLWVTMLMLSSSSWVWASGNQASITFADSRHRSGSEAESHPSWCVSCVSLTPWPCGEWERGDDHFVTREIICQVLVTPRVRWPDIVYRSQEESHLGRYWARRGLVPTLIINTNSDDKKLPRERILWPVNSE